MTDYSRIYEEIFNIDGTLRDIYVLGTTEQGGTRGSRAGTVLSIVMHEFADSPSSFPAFISLTSDLHETLRANTQRLPDLRAFERPVRIIFGTRDLYLNTGVAEHFHAVFPSSELFLLDKGHWVQLDGAPEVAQLLLSLLEEK